MLVKSGQEFDKMMLVVISDWINQHGSVIKYPLVILYTYVLTAATITTTGIGILEPRGHSMESEQNNSVVIIWRAYDCAVISEAVVTALFSPSASPYLHTHLHASCSLPHHHLCLHTKSSLRWSYMDSRALKWSVTFLFLAVSQFFLISSAGSTDWFRSRSLFQLKNTRSFPLNSISRGPLKYKSRASPSFTPICFVKFVFIKQMRGGCSPALIKHQRRLNLIQRGEDGRLCNKEKKVSSCVRLRLWDELWSGQPDQKTEFKVRLEELGRTDRRTDKRPLLP